MITAIEYDKIKLFIIKNKIDINVISKNKNVSNDTIVLTKAY